MDTRVFETIGIVGADLVIENVPEQLEIKRRIFEQKK
jgi:3-hydroxyacyl-CoA dehydrogenase